MAEEFIFAPDLPYVVQLGDLIVEDYTYTNVESLLYVAWHFHSAYATESAAKSVAGVVGKDNEYVRVVKRSG